MLILIQLLLFQTLIMIKKEYECQLNMSYHSTCGKCWGFMVYISKFFWETISEKNLIPRTTHYTWIPKGLEWTFVPYLQRMGFPWSCITHGPCITQESPLWLGTGTGTSNILLFKTRINPIPVVDMFNT